jgi:hypothetical protein
MGTKKLHVSLTRKTVSDVREDAFIFEVVFSGMSENELKDLFVDFSVLDIDSETNIPLYGLLWSHIVEPRCGLDGLVDCVVLYEKLEAAITEAGADVVVAHEDLNECHHALLEDVTSRTDTKLRNNHETPNRLLDLTSQYLRIGLILIDQMLNLVFALFVNRDRNVDVVFVPQAGREGSILPALSASDFDLSVCVYPLFHCFRRRYDQERGLASYEPTSLYATSGPRTIISEILFVISFTISIIRRGGMEANLTKHVESKHGRRMPATVRVCCQRAYREKLAGVFSFPAGKAVIEDTDCDAVVVGGPTVPCRGLLYAAEELNTDSYLVPHGITRPQEPLAPASTTMFVPGKFGKTYLESAFPADRLPDIVATGRPYLESQYGERRKQYDPPEEGEPIRIVLATQDFSDRVRETFVREMLAGIQRTEGAVEIIIKTHPSESTVLYEEVIGETELRNNRTIRIKKSGLNELMRWADILITINSNVGLEAIVMGTPSVSVNPFKPYIPTYPYASEDAIPELVTRMDIKNFFKRLDAETFTNLRERQDLFLERNYMLEEESPKRIADHIEESIN